MIIDGDRSLFKQGFEFFFGVGRRRSGFFGAGLKSEVVAEIGAAFIQNPLGLSLPAIIIGTALIKDTVEAATKIVSAERALPLPADKEIVRNFFFAFVTDFHGRKNTGNA